MCEVFCDACFESLGYSEKEIMEEETEIVPATREYCARG